MKHTIRLACILMAFSALSATAATFTITSHPGTDVTANFTTPGVSGDDGPVKSTFTFTSAKGLIGPTSNPSDQSGFANASKNLFAIAVEPVTKAAFVHFFLTQPKGGLLFVNDVNAKVSKLVPARWKGPALEFLRVESIHGRKVKLETTDYSHGPFKTYTFRVSVDANGGITLAP